MDLPTLYEDDSVVVVAKPAGLATLAHPRHTLPAVATLCAPSLPVHRLDNGTSGALLLAKDRSTYDALRAAFRAGTIIKRYAALVHGMTPATATWHWPIAHHPRKWDRMLVVPARHIACRGHPQAAATEITTCGHVYPDQQRSSPYSLLCVTITTGVRHQIRVHLAHAGHPIVGDPLYGGPHPSDDPTATPLLHAWQLGFCSPATGAPVLVTAPLPATFVDPCTALRIPATLLQVSFPAKRVDEEVPGGFAAGDVNPCNDGL
ncbi:MAG: RluA family pseudouridine synthase [Deltaproteobacteria bacterium]|nr:RluA family pseudouridine synthase [Deltaproteobacteria bacterium]